MFLYCFGEADGPFNCESCNCVTWNIYSAKNHEVGRRALRDGKALCESHKPQNIKFRHEHPFDTRWDTTTTEPTVKVDLPADLVHELKTKAEWHSVSLASYIRQLDKKCAHPFGC